MLTLLPLPPSPHAQQIMHGDEPDAATATLTTRFGCPPICGVADDDDDEATSPCCVDSCVGPRSGGPIGNYVWLCGCGDGSRARGGVGYPLFTQCIIGPDWGCSCATIALIVIPTSVHYAFVIRPMIHSNLLTIPVGVVAFVTGFGLLAAYLAVATADPGIIPRRAFLPPGEVRPNNMSLCGKCNVYRPPNATHCSTCNVCILGLDHHCPWTGKCIGKRNLCLFYLFLSAIVVHMFQSVCSTIYYVAAIVMTGQMATPI